jgi:hypothetical protein
MVRAKFVVSVVTRTNYGQVTVTLEPQYDTSIEEDKRFAKYTPTGSITLVIDNPAASGYLELGKAFYVDFTIVPQAAAA